MAAMPSNRVSTSNNQGAGTADSGPHYLPLMSGGHARRGGRSWVGACGRRACVPPTYRGFEGEARSHTPHTSTSGPGAPRAHSSEQRAIRTGGGS